MIQKWLRTEEKDAGNSFNCAQDQESSEVSEETDNGREGVVCHNAGENSMDI